MCMVDGYVVKLVFYSSVCSEDDCLNVDTRWGEVLQRGNSIPLLLAFVWVAASCNLLIAQH